MSWDAMLLSHEATLRLGCFFSIFLGMALWEWLSPQRQLQVPKARRWIHNLGLVVFNTVVLRVLFPTAAVGVALMAEQQGWGLFQRISAPLVVAVGVSVLVLDFCIYMQHRLFHALPWLWRLHRVHHADLDYDVTTGARFHPIEIILSMLIKIAIVCLLGAPAVAVMLFEVLLNATAMFNHANVRLSPKVDAGLRWLLVTPDMHRVHHSVQPQEMNANFGFSVPWWDRLFGTYVSQPQGGQQGFTVGVKAFRNPAQVNTLMGMLAMPFAQHTSKSREAEKP